MSKFQEQDIAAMHDRDLAKAIYKYCDSLAPKERWYTDDLLSGMEPPEIRPGLRLDARIRAVVTRDSRGNLEIDSFELGEVYIKPDSLDDILLLDQTALKTRHKALYDEFESWATKETLEQASEADDGLSGPNVWIAVSEEES